LQGYQTSAQKTSHEELAIFGVEEGEIEKKKWKMENEYMKTI